MGHPDSSPVPHLPKGSRCPLALRGLRSKASPNTHTLLSLRVLLQTGTQVLSCGPSHRPVSSLRIHAVAWGRRPEYCHCSLLQPAMTKGGHGDPQRDGSGWMAEGPTCGAPGVLGRAAAHPHPPEAPMGASLRSLGPTQHLCPGSSSPAVATARWSGDDQGPGTSSSQA